MKKKEEIGKQRKPNLSKEVLAPGKWRKFAWHHVRTQVPPDWEVPRYALADRVGRVEFNTRRGLEATVGWEPCSREPDSLTTMTTFLVNNILGKKNAPDLRSDDISTATVGEFLVGWLDESTPCQAMAFNPSTMHLIRWVFEGHSSKKGREEIIRPILEAFDFNDDENACEYNMHGIHCRLPWDYKIEDVVVLPANVLMNFESETTKRKVVFRRWGLADMVFRDNDLTEFYRPILMTNSIRVDGSTPCHVNGHNARRLIFNAPREHHKERFMSRRWHNGKALIWHDEPENRIYACEQIGPDGTPELDFMETLPGTTITD